MSKTIITWLISLLLVAYGSYNIWAIYLTGDFWFLLWVIVCFAGAIGLVLSKPWSQYCVHVVSFFTVGGWFYVTISIALHGWPYPGIMQTIISLVPGLLLSMVCVLSSIYVFKKFRSVANRT
jgi:hypothetical protein